MSALNLNLPTLPPLWTPRRVRAAVAGGLLLLLAALAWQCVAIVPPGHRGVLVTLGKVSPDVLPEGLHLRVPVAQTVVLMNVQVQKGEGGDAAASRDLQQVNVKVAINYRIDPLRVAEVFQGVGSIEAVGDRFILPAVHEAVKAAVAQFTAEELVTRRTEVRERIRAQLDQRLAERGVIVEDFAITGFSFSKEFEAAIEDKSRAEQQRLKAERDLERIRVEAEQTLTRARAEAESTLAQRRAEAQGLAELQSRITPELLQWEAVRRWDGQLPEIVAGSAPGLMLPLPQTPVRQQPPAGGGATPLKPSSAP
jgi:prohibitin 2